MKLAERILNETKPKKVEEQKVRFELTQDGRTLVVPDAEIIDVNDKSHKMYALEKGAFDKMASEQGLQISGKEIKKDGVLVGLLEKMDVKKVIGDLIDTSFGGSNEDQMKAVQLLKGLATSEDPLSNKFMKALDKATSGMDKKMFEMEMEKEDDDKDEE